VRKENIYTAKEKKVNENYFIGDVIIREVIGEGVIDSDSTSSAEQEMYHVTFQNGALTTLHYHESDQVLISTEGKGVVGLIKGGNSITDFKIDDNDIIFLEEEGDTVCIPANKLHFHGAIRGGNFSHIAIRKIHKETRADNNDIKRAENRWVYDLISEEIGNTDPQAIEKIAKEIAEKIQMAVSKNLDRKSK